MKRGWLVIIGLVVMGCATMTHPLQDTLTAPGGTLPAAATALEEGNKLYAARQWELAKSQYEAAIKAQPSLAEAHYNLALVLDVLQDDRASRRHFMEAATLAPGHKVIWNSPPLRQHGDVEAHPKGGSFITPAMGVH